MRLIHFITVITAVIVLLIADKNYFEDLREGFDGGRITEGFLHKGVLGDLLRKGHYISIDKESSELAAQDMCFDEDTLGGFQHHDLFRLRVKLKARQSEQIQIQLLSPQKSGKQRVFFAEKLKLSSASRYYSVSFRANLAVPLTILIISNTNSSIRLDEAIIDGRFGRRWPLVLDSQKLDYVELTQTTIKTDSTSRSKSRILLNRESPVVELALGTGLPKHFYSGLFPGKKNNGYCTYAASRPDHSKPGNHLIPRVDLTIDDKLWFGPNGLVANKKRAKGRSWEIPAELKIRYKDQSLSQAVGLRFHGGTPVREKPYANSYRLYARKEYGTRSIPDNLVFEQDKAREVRTLVLKFTHHGNLFDELVEFNPFNHAFALAIANRIGALVPRHNLVDLYVNGKPEGLYLALEHLSEKTIKNWLESEEFSTYTYKKNNSRQQERKLKAVMNDILAQQGESAFKKLIHYYDIDNVVNSIILSSYIADFDYCQGVELFAPDPSDDKKVASVTSINWDLDHAFIFLQNNELKVSGHHVTFPLIDISSDVGNTKCPRHKIYAWVYKQSTEFRSIFRQRLEDVFRNELNKEGISELLQPYGKINEKYLSGEFSNAISDLENYSVLRPDFLLDALDDLEYRTIQSSDN
jgi:hypothetical protein